MSHEPSGRGAERFVRLLPPNPNLDKQRKLAKALARDYWRGDSEAIERVRALHPKPPTPENFVLSDAQLVIARGYNFTGWPHMKKKIESLRKSPAELFQAAVEAGDVDYVRQLLQFHPDLVSKINEPMFGFKSPAVHVARTNLELLDLLLAHGADLNARTSWEKGGFGVLEQVNPDEAAPLIARGARIGTTLFEIDLGGGKISLARTCVAEVMRLSPEMQFHRSGCVDIPERATPTSPTDIQIMLSNPELLRL